MNLATSRKIPFRGFGHREDDGVRSWNHTIDPLDSGSMARPLRIEYPGAVYHVTSRGNARQDIVADDRDRSQWLTLLAHVVDRYGWRCHAYCLMDNHYHLLIETPQPNLSLGMRQLNGRYTQIYNRRYERVGHLFQGRFTAILVEKEAHLLELCRYVVLNPVRANMVAQPRQWAWSSYRTTVGDTKASDWLTIDWILGQFGVRVGAARERYRTFVAEGRGGTAPVGGTDRADLSGLRGVCAPAPTQSGDPGHSSATDAGAAAHIAHAVSTERDAGAAHPYGVPDLWVSARRDCRPFACACGHGESTFEAGGAGKCVIARPDPIADPVIRAGVTYQIISDHLGTPRLVINIANGTIGRESTTMSMALSRRIRILAFSLSDLLAAFTINTQG